MRTERYHVFNAEQIEGLPPRFYAASERDEPDLQRPEQFFGAIGARIEEGGDTASYSPIKDLIRMAPVRLVPPRRRLLRDAGPRTRSLDGTRETLAQGFKGQFGDPVYAKEELVDELTAAGLGALSGPSSERLPFFSGAAALWCATWWPRYEPRMGRTDTPSQEAGRKETEACPSRPMLLATES